VLNFFEQKEDSLIFRENGETVMITPWGANSLRVRASFLGEITQGSVALLPPQSVSDVQIEINEQEASIQNGSIRAVLKVNSWGNALQTIFYGRDGEILLQEIPNGGAHHTKPDNLGF